MDFEITRIVQREKTWEYWAKIFSDEGTLIMDNYIFQPAAAAQLPEPALRALFMARVFPQFEESTVAPEIIYTAGEITNILIEKGYLSEGEIFPDDLGPAT